MSKIQKKNDIRKVSEKMCIFASDNEQVNDVFIYMKTRYIVALL